MSEALTFVPSFEAPAPVAIRSRRSLGVRIALVWEVITGGLIEL